MLYALSKIQINIILVAYIYYIVIESLAFILKLQLLYMLQRRRITVNFHPRCHVTVEAQWRMLGQSSIHQAIEILSLLRTRSYLESPIVHRSSREDFLNNACTLTPLNVVNANNM